MLLQNKRFKTLIIDDHPIIIEGYKNILYNANEFSLQITSATNCDEALNLLRHPKDLVLLDLQLPVSRDGKYISGEDIGLWLRKNAPKTKIIILTAIADTQRIYNIIKNINPLGFIIKSDLTSADLISATKSVLSNNLYYSETVKNIANNNNNNNNNNNLDDIDRKLLYHLSMGETNKDTAIKLHLSLRAVEDRKSKLKDFFGVNKRKNTNLIKEAKKRNII